MRCFSLQPLMAAATLEGFGLPYTPRPDLCRRDGWAGATGAQAAYTWMTARLREHSPPPTPDALPVWVWVGRHPPNWEGVTGSYLTLELDPARMLISNYDTWDALLGQAVLQGRAVQDDEWATCLRDPWSGSLVQGVLWELRPDDTVNCHVHLP